MANDAAVVVADELDAATSDPDEADEHREAA